MIKFLLAFFFISSKKFSKEVENRVEVANDELQQLLKRIQKLKNEESVVHAKCFNVRDQMDGLTNSITEYRSFIHQVASMVKSTFQVNYLFVH